MLLGLYSHTITVVDITPCEPGMLRNFGQAWCFQPCGPSHEHCYSTVPFCTSLRDSTHTQPFAGPAEALAAALAPDQRPPALSPALVRATKAHGVPSRSPLPLTDSNSPMNARPSPRTADDHLSTLRQVLEAKADTGQPGGWLEQSAHSRTQGVIMHAAAAEEDTCQSLFSSKTDSMCKIASLSNFTLTSRSMALSFSGAK